MEWLDKTTRRITRVLCFFKGLITGGAVAFVLGGLIYAICFFADIEVTERGLRYIIVISVTMGIILGIYVYRSYLQNIKETYRKKVEYKRKG